MTGFALLLLTAAAAFGLAKLTRLPPIPLLLLGGIGLRYLADAGGIEAPQELVRELIEIGLAVLVFTAGVDLSPRRIRGRSRPVAIVAVAQFFILMLAGSLTAILLGYGLTTALYLGCALSASSTLVVVRHLQQRQQMFEPFGRLVLGVLLLQDVFIVILLVAFLRAPDGAVSVLSGIASTAGLGFLAWMLHRWTVPWLAKHIRLDDEELMLGALGLLFAFSGLAYLLELPFLVGAFLAGFALSAFPMNGLVRGMLGSLSGFFLALFFISIGAVLTLPTVEMLIDGTILVIVLIVVTVSLVAVVGEAVGYSTRASIETGLLLSQTSEFSILLALAGLASGQITAELFSLIALITVGTMTLTPFISRPPVAWALMKLHPRYRRGEVGLSAPGEHAVLLGYGRSGPQTLKTLKEHGIPVVVVDDDAAVIRRLIARGIPCIQGDGSDERILKQANCRNARVVFCSLRRTRDAELVLDWMRGSPARVIVRTFEPDEAAMVEAAGGIPLKTAAITSETFLNWFATNVRGSTTNGD